MLETIGFGGGCHWCTEAVFAALRGVVLVEQGFIRSTPPADQWSEAVRVTFETDQIDRSVLIEIHLRTHSSTSTHSMREKYRSAIYVTSDRQERASALALPQLQDGFDAPLITQLLRLEEFQASPERFRDYYEKDPERPFCKRFIDPKLALIRKDYAAYAC